MSAEKKGHTMQQASGFINLNKPSGVSSAAMVSKIKRLTGVACGHMGTLDPMASGVLPVAVGNSSRLFNYLLNKEKIYRAVFRFGQETDTLDALGTVLCEGKKIPTQEEINDKLQFFVGEIEQLPPAYSAKSVNGVRAYQLARQGKPVLLQAKKCISVPSSSRAGCLRTASNLSFPAAEVPTSAHWAGTLPRRAGRSPR